MVVVKRQRLLAVHGIFRMIHIQHQRCQRLRKTGDELLDQSLTRAINVACAGGMLKLEIVTADVSASSTSNERLATGAQTEHCIMTQGLAVISILIAGGSWNTR